DLRRADGPRRLLSARGHRASLAQVARPLPILRPARRRTGSREPRRMTDAALTVDNLSIRFGGLHAVEAMSFEVREGEVLSLIGPNGAGKTSAFNAITGYVQPAGGRIAYRGTSLIGRTPNQIAELGVVRTFQKTSVFTGLTVFDNVMIGLHLRSRQKPI